MNYKEKYIKYKNKYIQLKNQIAGSNLIDELLKLYPVCKYDGSLNNKYENHKITYGEMDYEGIDSLIKFLNKSFSSFIDIGSGRGKLCIYLLKYPSINKSIGIELVKERHDDAIELKNKLKHFDQINNVKFINNNFLDIKLKELDLSDTLIWFSNLCFNQDTTNNIYNKVINDLPSGTIICSSKNPTLNLDKLESLGETSIKMSWNSASTVYCYKLL
jgi:SAM-dependent methyltransferase